MLFVVTILVVFFRHYYNSEGLLYIGVFQKLRFGQNYVPRKKVNLLEIQYPL